MQNLRSRFHRLSSTFLAILLGCVLAATLTPGAAVAATAAPTGLAPDGAAVAGSPVLSWNRVASATSYTVEYSLDSNFDTGVTRITTVNQRYVPTRQLPQGQMWWQVRANGPGGASDWSIASFDASSVAGPTPLAPLDGALLDQPEDPVLLSWTPINGAATYTVEVDDSPDFLTPTITNNVRTTSFIVANPQVATSYSWRVKAVFDGGVQSLYSDVRTFQIGGLTVPTLVSPPDDPNNVIDDVVLEWEPVLGAARYELQVSTADSFATLVDNKTNILGTSYSPTTTYNNDQYYWRVRPVDPFGNKLDWSAVEVWEFRRAWPDQPVLEYPADGSVVGDPFYFQWDPVPLASVYTVQISTSSNFPNTSATRSCTTVHTTFVPRNNTNPECWPASVNTYYWRVLVEDDPGNVTSERDQAEVHVFSYDPEIVDLDTISPADGATGVEVPTLSWEPVAGAASYRVSLTALDGGTGGFTNRTTTTTSYSPITTALEAGKTYRWNVVTASDTGRLGAALVPEAQPTFTMADPLPAGVAATPTPLSPANGSVHPRFPNLRWAAVEGAAYYRLQTRNADGIAAFTPVGSGEGTRFPHPTGEDANNSNLPGNVEWRVVAYDAANTVLETGPSRVFTIVTPDVVTGFRASLTGEASTGSPSACTATLPARCEDLRQTPVLRWNPVPDAGFYRIWISRDPTFTNVVIGGNPGLDVEGTMYSPNAALPDSQAADAYYWQVVPCTYDEACAPRTTATHAFNKRSNAVQLISPAPGATLPDTITFEWNSYLDTNLNGPGHLDATLVPSRIEARQYFVEVSTVPNFQTLVDSATVDQKTYTANTKVYPEGILYWRVTARDGTNNLLSASEVRTFTKSSAAPVLEQLNGGAPLTAAAPFTWEPTPYTASYNLEVYANGDTVPSPANRVVNLTGAKQSALTLPLPLPPSSTPYTWRVRKVDASGNLGAWTSLTDPFASFLVVETAPGQVSPAAGVQIPSAGGYFTWTAVQGARSYRYERRRAGDSSLSESQVTSSLAWAQTKAIPDGGWQWRVVALNSDNKPMGASPWRGFTVDAKAPTVIKTKPAANATGFKRGANIKATFSEPVTNVRKATVKLRKFGKTKAVKATIKMNASRTVVTINPNKKLAGKTRYTVTISAAVRDLSGIPMAAPKVWSFTTK